jgi:hypothetical protein
MDEDAWQAWSAEINRRLRESNRRLTTIEKWLDTKDRNALFGLLGRALGELRAEVHKDANELRKDLGLPTIKPRYRVRAGTGQTWRTDR